ncbi:hypothetical protein [Aquirhabdus sp.]|uniref:hypothetical protein n=1 Tax=Aquirhabdus sp. TaxID=2824160 RepID=UPI00396CDEBC
MSFIALLLLTLSAIAHASWNLFGKRAGQAGVTFYSLTTVATAAVSLPFLVYFGRWFTELPSFFWLFVCATGIAQGVYFIGLAGTYQHGAFGLSYPLARALPVLLVPLGSVIFLNGELDFAAICGMVIVVMAMLSLVRIHHSESSQVIAIGFAVIAALGTVAYSLIDYHALQRLQDWYPREPKWHLMLFYASCEAWATMVFLACIFFSKIQRIKLKDTYQIHAKTAFLAGVMMFITYALVLLSYMLVTNVSYAVAFRQLSIPIGVFLSIVFLHEKISLKGVFSNLFLLLGLVMIVINS